MSRTIQEIRAEVLTLSPSERASLAHDLILSLNDPSELDLSPEQEAEIQRRLRTIEEGSASGRPADDVFSEIRSRHAR